MDDPHEPDFRVVLRPLRSSIPAAIRLRKFLKLALRAFAFRCIEVIEINEVDNGRPVRRK